MFLLHEVLHEQRFSSMSNLSFLLQTYDAERMPHDSSPTIKCEARDVLSSRGDDDDDDDDDDDVVVLGDDDDDDDAGPLQRL